jgi:hypothetical protein
LADLRDELVTLSAGLAATLPALRHQLKALYRVAASLNRRRAYAWHAHMPPAMAALGQVGYHVAAAARAGAAAGSGLAALAATEHTRWGSRARWRTRGDSPPLPWEVAESRGQPGAFYFRNTVTGASTWALPDWEQVPAAAAPAAKAAGAAAHQTPRPGSRAAVVSLRRRIAAHSGCL